MIRVLLFFAVLGAIAFGASWLVDRPGEIVLTWQGYETRTSVLVGFCVFFAAAALVAMMWNFARLAFRLPSRLAQRARSRRRDKGYAALTRGVIAVSAGDSFAARRHAVEAERLLDNEPLALLLRAQAAQLVDDRVIAETSFNQMLAAPETRLLGLRGLHVEARRRGDGESAYHYASEAQKLAPLPWAGHAVLDHHAAKADWAGALAAVERNAAGGIIDKATANRQRAVLNTALAQDRADREPEAALALAREAFKLAPNLIPAAVLAGGLATRFGDVRKAVRMLEAAWKLQPHPDVAAAYLNVRPGDSARDRLLRAQVLGELALEHPESHLAVGRAALEAREIDLARKTMAPLFLTEEPYGRPTVRACLLMVDIEEVDGAPGRAREWLARASRAARDAVWIADGVVSDRWAPVSPITGRLDAFTWRQPSEQLSGPPPAPFPMSADPAIVATDEPLPLIAQHAIDPPPPAPVLDGPSLAEGQPPTETSGRIEKPAEFPQLPPSAVASNGRISSAPAIALGAPISPQLATRPVVFSLALAPDDPGSDGRARRH